MYLPSCSIQGLSYTRLVLFPYLYVYFFLQLMYILCHYHLFLQSIPSIYTSLEKTNFLYLSSKLLIVIFSCVPSNFQPLLFFSILSFFYVSSRLFIYLYIVIKSSLSFNVVKCIFFNLFSYVRSSNSGIILVAILCILSKLKN